VALTVAAAVAEVAVEETDRRHENVVVGVWRHRATCAGIEVSWAAANREGDVQ